MRRLLSVIAIVVALPMGAAQAQTIWNRVAACDPSFPDRCITAGTPAKYLSAASTNATLVKASAGVVSHIVAINTTATLYYLKFYNKASAPTCNSDTVVQTYPIPASTSGAGFVLTPPLGVNFTTGIGFCITGGIADNDNTNAAAGIAVSIGYR